MDRKEFLQQVKNRIKEYLPQEFSAMEPVIHEAVIEGKIHAGLGLKEPGSRRELFLDLEEAWQGVSEGTDLEHVLKHLADVYAEVWKLDGQDTHVVTMSRDEMMKNLHVAILNFKMEKKALGQLPFLKVNDLVIVPMLRLLPDVSRPLSLHNAKEIGLSGDLLLAAALKNHTSVYPPFVAEVTEDSLKKMDTIDLTTNDRIKDDRAYIVTNKERAFGSAVMADKSFLDRLGQKLGGDFYMLPASQHDFMVVPKEMGLQLEELQALMWDLHVSVETKDFLSSHVYHYDTKSRAVEMFDGKYHADTVRGFVDGSER